MAKTDNTGKNRGKFQGSETSSVIIRYMRQNENDPVLLTSEISLEGRRPTDKAHALISLNTNKQLGPASGTWGCQIKASPEMDELFRNANDDDWVDISFRRHGVVWHTMRGLVDDIRRTEMVAGTGATTEVYQLSGRDFGKIFEDTPIYFNMWADPNLALDGGASGLIFSNTDGLLGPPANAVEGFLKKFLGAVGDAGRAVWDLPVEMGNVAGAFIENVNFDLSDQLFSGEPARTAINHNHLMPRGTCWDLAKEFSDPLTTELFVDLLIQGDGALIAAEDLSEGITDEETEMTVVFRPKPFPNLTEQLASPWFKLPTFTIPRQQIVNTNIGRSGAERYNAFFVVPQLYQEALGANSVEIEAPLWNPNDMLKHGMKRFQANLMYMSEDDATFLEFYRERFRDWYALNPYFLNGSINLGMGRPDIRIGCRARIPGVVGPGGEDDQETYYIEQVGHNWMFGQGLKTTIGVTRGYIGSDNSLMDDLSRISADYSIPSKSSFTPNVAGGSVLT